MTSTSVYLIPVFQILEARGLEVFLVNAQQVKNVPGRKTDVSDCQWLQYLHSVGLLRASFRPPRAICAIRALWGHRGSLIQMAAEHVMHIQKALDQMNLQVHRVLSEITGLSGLRILDAILAGERDPLTLARLCHSRVKSNETTVAKSLEGDYRAEHIFALRQSLAAYRYYQQLVVETDHEIQRQLGEIQAADTALAKMPKRTKRLAYQRQGHEPRVFDLRRELYRIFGVDLTNVPGISAMTAQTVLCELGTDVYSLSKCIGIRFVARSVSGKEDQRRKSSLYQKQTGPEPDCHRTSPGGPVLTSCQRLHGRVLSPHLP